MASAKPSKLLSQQRTQDTLQLAFCPPLESTVVAALLSDIDIDDPQQYEELYSTLSLLAAQAHAESDDIPNADLEVEPAFSVDGSSSSCTLASNSTTTTGSSSTLPNQPKFDTPLGFLQTAFPHLPSSVLCDALYNADILDFEENEVDLSNVIETLLNHEFVRDLEERGLSDDDEEDEGWQEVHGKKGKTPNPNRQHSKVPSKKGRTFKLVDIRQQHHSTPTGKAKNDSTPDPWVHISSLASRLSTLLPPHTPETFQSLFHKPAYPTTSAALRAFLATECNKHRTLLDLDTRLISLVEILSGSINTSEECDQQQLVSDAELCLKATNGRPEDALDLVLLLRDLKDGAEPIWHAAVPSVSTPISPVSPFSPRSTKFKGKPKRVNLSDEGSHFRSGRDALEYRRQQRELNLKRAEALRHASQHWRKNRNGAYGGEIAFYYAEEARKYQQQSREYGIKAAQASVAEKQLNGVGHDRNAIDLHGLTIPESIAVVQEKLRHHTPSIARPLKIITGKGNHSKGQVGVLRPAVKKMLEEEGYNVATFDAGLVIRGRSG